MKIQIKKNEKRSRLKAKIRAKIFGTADQPRLSVYRSNKFIYAQLINDEKGVTLAQASDVSLTKGTKIERAQQVGAQVGALAIAKGISKVVFDRNGFKYIGRVKLLADAARKAGLIF